MGEVLRDEGRGSSENLQASDLKTKLSRYNLNQILYFNKSAAFAKFCL